MFMVSGTNNPRRTEPNVKTPAKIGNTVKLKDPSHREGRPYVKEGIALYGPPEGGPNHALGSAEDVIALTDGLGFQRGNPCSPVRINLAEIHALTLGAYGLVKVYYDARNGYFDEQGGYVVTRHHEDPVKPCTVPLLVQVGRAEDAYHFQVQEIHDVAKWIGDGRNVTVTRIGAGFIRIDCDNGKSAVVCGRRRE